MSTDSGHEKLPALFKSFAESIAGSMYESVALRSWRYRLATELGRSLHPDDNKRINYTEFNNIKNMESRFSQFELPSIAEITKDANKPDQEKISELRLALATKPVAARVVGDKRVPNIRDFRNSSTQPMHDDRGMIAFKDGGEFFDNTTYEARYLFLALLADSQGQEEADYSIVPYPHLNPDDTIKSVTLLIMSKNQREGLKQALLKLPTVKSQIG